MLYWVEKIARVDTPELQLGGRGGYEFMLVPEVAASSLVGLFDLFDWRDPLL
jgi:hypothetical protein